MELRGALFSAHRRRLFGIAYRMLGSRAEKEIVELTYAVALINAWTRVAIGLRHPVRKADLLPREEAVTA